ncbi:PREDICTED: heat shock protein beta-9 [Elephantulus edwardii]|uniref:heat shock protein beta-9 n=1 Tax=Elephantulus edwardii TaxID=28737 RepID=UPI0003F0DD71|nr:PREDICTED: heat shock protein beta-9 [Elephantulus edwardii]
MQQAGSGFSNDKQVAAFSSSSPALVEQTQGARLPVWLLKDDQLPAQNDPTQSGFQLKVDTHGFNPEELEVRVDGRCLTVTGQQQMESCGPNGGIRMKRKVHREMQLPPDLDPATLTCMLSPSGYLCVQSQCPVLPVLESWQSSTPNLESHYSRSYNLA